LNNGTLSTVDNRHARLSDMLFLPLASIFIAWNMFRLWYVTTISLVGGKFLNASREIARPRLRVSEEKSHRARCISFVSSAAHCLSLALFVGCLFAVSLAHSLEILQQVYPKIDPGTTSICEGYLCSRREGSPGCFQVHLAFSFLCECYTLSVLSYLWLFHALKTPEECLGHHRVDRRLRIRQSSRSALRVFHGHPLMTQHVPLLPCYSFLAPFLLFPQHGSLTDSLYTGLGLQQMAHAGSHRSNPRLNGRYILFKMIGSGSCGAFSVQPIIHDTHYITFSGKVFLGFDTTSSEIVAIKLESVDTRYPLLEREANIYEVLAGGAGIPSFHCYGSIERDCNHASNAMVLELLGLSLEDLFNFCNRKFSLKTVLLLADQLVRTLHIHHLSFPTLVVFRFPISSISTRMISFIVISNLITS